MKSKIIFMGSIPPPYIGPSVATVIILNSGLKNMFDLIHLDTSDHRSLDTLGAIDFRNIYLAMKHYIVLFWLIITRWPEIVYIPLSQTTAGYLRDAGFILISKIFGRKVVCHLRGGNFGNWFACTNIFMRSFVRTVHSLVDGQILLGEKLRNLFQGIIPAKKIYIVPNGGNFGINYEQKRSNERVRILYLANFHRTKGILDALGAAPDVYRSHKDAEFLFAGDFVNSDVKQEVNLFLREFKEIPVKFEGPVHGKKKRDLFVSSDIFIFPTYYPPEGHPWVILEAMAAGLPIITTDQGAITESVIDGVNGFIVDKRSPDQIVGKVKLLIENPQIREKMGEESRRLYLENFTEEKMVERLASAFYKVLES